jgi:hypothetical protein
MWFKNFFGGSTSNQSRKSLRGASTVSLSLETLEQRETPSGGLVLARIHALPTPDASTVGVNHIAPTIQVDYASLQP